VLYESYPKSFAAKIVTKSRRDCPSPPTFDITRVSTLMNPDSPAPTRQLQRIHRYNRCDSIPCIVILTRCLSGISPKLIRSVASRGSDTLSSVLTRESHRTAHAYRTRNHAPLPESEQGAYRSIALLTQPGTAMRGSLPETLLEPINYRGGRTCSTYVSSAAHP